jgi:hypothetical protein
MGKGRWEASSKIVKKIKELAHFCHYVYENKGFNFCAALEIARMRLLPLSYRKQM